MIPQFPTFEKLSLAHRDDIHAVTWQHEPYSDYNFTSLWVWDVEEQVEVSAIHDNIAIRFSGYQKGEQPFYSFLGTEQVVATASELLAYSVGQGLEAELKLVPQCVIDAGGEVLMEAFQVVEDRDHLDYILSVPGWVSLDGPEYKKHRKAVRKFVDTHDSFQTVILDPANREDQERIRTCVVRWAAQKNTSDLDQERELLSLERLFLSAAEHDVSIVGIELEGIIHAVQIFEIVQQGYAIAHFFKADTSFPGIFQYLDTETMKQLHDRGVMHYNIEQDLGIEGLRTAKMDARPVHFLKKYTIRTK